MEHGEHYLERIGRARALLESRLDEDLPLEDVARAACLSPFYFHRLFRGVTGETVREHVRRLRLERAVFRMVHGEDDLLGVAFDAGYQSNEAFTRAFKRHFGVPPSAHRAAMRRINERRSEQKGANAMDVSVVTRQPARAVCIRHTGPYTEVGAVWGRLFGWAMPKGIRGEAVGLCYDDPEVTPPDKLRYDACIVVDGDVETGDGVQMTDLPHGTYARALHEGAYERLAETYGGLAAAVAQGEIGGKRWSLGDQPSIEVYLNTPMDTAPEDLRTEVMLRVV